jgi:hypothetical protein
LNIRVATAGVEAACLVAVHRRNPIEAFMSCSV